MRTDRHRRKPNSELNLCMSGRIAPELFIMGAAKAGTTSFAVNFRRSPNVRFPRCIDDHPNMTRCKEMRYFGHEDRMAMGKENWLQYYPICNQDVRIVSTDLSPRYHYNPEVPGQLLQYYGKEISRVVFLTLLREPLSILQSHYYYQRRHEEDSNDRFSSWIFKMIDGTPGKKGAMKNAMYAVSLSRIFETLNRTQFIICPLKYAFAATGSTPPVFEGLWKRFGLQKPNNYTGDVLEHNRGDHPDLSDEMDYESLERVKTFVYNITGSQILSKLFAAGSPQEAPHLYAYEGAPDDSDAIMNWIEDGW